MLATHFVGVRAPIIADNSGGNGQSNPTWPTFSYQGSAPPFPLGFGVFLCSNVNNTQAHGCLLQYDYSVQYGLVDDVTAIQFLARPIPSGALGAAPAAEVGTLLVNAATLSFTLPPQVYRYDGSIVSNTVVEAAIRGIVADQHTGAYCQWQDSGGNSWMGTLIVTPTSFDHQPGGFLGVSATWVEVY